MRHLPALSAFAFSVASATAAPAAVQDAQAWEIGPDVRGRNYSVGMPPRPTPVGRSAWSFDFPYPHPGAGHVHAVTFNPGPLLGANRIVMRYRIDAARGVRFAPQETPDQAATVSLYFQRSGDSWSGKRQYEFYRWYLPARLLKEVAPGEYEISVSLSDPGWTSVQGRPVSANPDAFRAALAETGRIGIAFGSEGRRAHGIYSSGPASFTLTDFRIL